MIKKTQKSGAVSNCSTGDSLKSNPLSRNAIVQLFAAAIAFKHRKHLVSVAVEDTVDGVLASHVLDLATTEVEMLGQDGGVAVVQFGDHLLPNLAAHRGIGLVEPDLVEESTLKGTVEVLGEVGGGS